MHDDPFVQVPDSLRPLIREYGHLPMLEAGCVMARELRILKKNPDRVTDATWRFLAHLMAPLAEAKDHDLLFDSLPRPT